MFCYQQYRIQNALHKYINNQQLWSARFLHFSFATTKSRPQYYCSTFINHYIIIMKLLIVAALVSSSAAFAPSPIARTRSVAPLFESATASAIEAALEASKTHGPTSKEAQLLWEVVEEMNASDNRCVGSRIYVAR